MEPLTLLLAVAGGIALLLVLILYFKIHPFIGLFLASIAVGLLAGMPHHEILGHLQKGMGETLGFVAVVVGLGSLFGALLENSGGAHALANFMVQKAGEKRAPWAIAFTGLLVGIPVFFEVGFVILVPMIYALQRKTRKPLLLYGIPLLAGLAVTHAFIPPHPGPIAVAEIIGANTGWVIVTGLVAGIPAVVLAGPVFGKYIAKRVAGTPPEHADVKELPSSLPPMGLVLSMICAPIGIILANSLINNTWTAQWPIPHLVRDTLRFIGHPFAALILVNLLAWYFLGIRRGFSKEKLLKISSESLAPAGAIILIIGAGGMFKQILTQTGAGAVLANAIMATGISYLLFSFAIAAIIRILQGSATVAMITAAGITASLTTGLHLGELEKALIVTSIAAGATILSHVNDGGFWLVSRYFGLTEKQTLASWTITTTIIAFTALVMVLVMGQLFI